MSLKTRVSKISALTSINHYSRKDINHHIKGSDSAANRRTLVIVPIAVDIDDRLGSGRLDRFTTLTDTEIDLNTDTYWDKKSIAATWTAKTYALNEVAKPTVANNYIYLCTQAGASGASEPTWGTTPGGTTADGATIWTCYKDYTVAANRAGVDFYIYACMQAGGTPLIRLSASPTYPLGYTANNSRKIGGFHCMPYVTAPTWLAATVTTINYVVQPVTPNATNRYLYRATSRAGDYKTGAVEPNWPTTPGQTVVDNNVTWTCDINFAENLASTHRFYNFQMGDIHRNSVWDIKDRSRATTQAGMAKGTSTPEDGTPRRWGNIYLSSGDGTIEDSIFGATIKDTIDWNTFVHYAKLRGKRLMRDAEFQEFAFNGNEQTNIAGSADPGIVTFPLDTTGRAMISDWGLIGMAGVMYQWLDEQSYRLDYDGSVQAASQTATITYAASLEGVAVYLLWAGPVPYLGANIAADVWIAAGSYKFQIKAVADPVAAGGVQIYFRDAASQPLRLYAVVQSGQNAAIQASNPDFSLPIVYHATPATQGVEVRYDNVTHSRLEAINAGGVNASIDLATSPGWSWYALPGSAGQLYKQGNIGDVKLLAGGSWPSGASCGSRSRHADYRRSAASSSIGSRALSEPV